MTNKKPILSSSLNFDLFWGIFKQKKLSKIECYLSLIILYSQMIIFHIQRYSEVTKYKNDLTFNVIKDMTYYFYIINLIDIHPLVYITLRIGLMIIPIIFFLIYLIMLFAKYSNNKKPDKPIKKLFILNYIYYPILIFFPSIEVTFRDLFCDNILLNKLTEKCLEGTQIYFFGLSLFSLMCNIIMISLIQIYTFNGIYDKKNLFSGENRNYEILLTISRFILVSTAVIDASKTWFMIIFLAINIIISIILLTVFIYYLPYNKIVIENIILACLCILFTDSVFFLIANTRAFDISVNQICTFFAIFILYNRRKKWAILKVHINNPNDLILLVSNLQHLKNHNKLDTDDELYFRGLYERHNEFCKDIACFCKQLSIYDSKSNKDISLEKRYYNKSIVIKFFIRQLFESQLRINKDQLIIISYAEFLFEKFKNVPLSLYHISQLMINNRYIYPNIKFRIFKLRYKISEYICTRNQEALAKPLELENVIYVEEQFEKVLESMQNIIKAALKFWEYLINKEIDLNTLNNLSKILLTSVDESNKLWHPLKIYLTKKKKLRYYYNWYLKDFLNKKILLTEEEIEELLEDETLSVHSLEFLNNLKNDNIIFQHDTCVIHMSGNIMSMGKVLKINKAATKVFGYQKIEIENNLVNVLMPSLISVNHSKYLEAFLQSGKSKVLYNQKKIFAIDKKGFLIPLWVVVKQLDDLNGNVQYAALIRPLTEKQEELNHYLIFDEYGEINGISQSLSDQILIDPGFLEQFGYFNVVVLAPKLVKYFGLIKPKSEGVNENAVNRSASMTNLSVIGEDEEMQSDTDDDELFDSFLSMDEDDDEGQLELQLQDKVDPNSRILNFMLRVPKKLPKFIDEISHLTNKIYTDLSVKGNIKTYNRMNTYFSNSSKKRTLGRPSVLKFMNSTELSLDNPLVLSAYLRALRTIAEKIINNPNNNTFKIKAIIKTDYYGPDGDILKYMRILSIIKKEEKFKKFASFNKTAKYYLNQKNSARSDESKRTESEEETTYPNLLGKSVREEQKDEQMLLSENGNDSKTIMEEDELTEKEFKIGEKSLDGSQRFKQRVITDMKSGLSNAISNLYHKEENFLIHKNLGSLNQVKWFIRLLFFIMIPINIFSFIFGANQAFSCFQKASNDINISEVINRNYLRCHHAISTLILNQTNIYAQNDIAFNSYLNSQMVNLKACAYNLQQINKDATWTQLLTQVTKSIQKSNHIIYPDGQFENVDMPTYYIITKLFNIIQDIVKYNTTDFNDYNDIISTYRWNSFENIYLILEKIIYNSLQLVKLDFATSEFLSVISLIIEGIIFVISFLIILKLIFNVIFCFKIILEVFTYIDEHHIKEILLHYKRLKSYFSKAKSTRYDLDNEDNIDKSKDLKSRSNSPSKSNFKKSDYVQKAQKKVKLIHSNGFLKQTKYKILNFYFGSILISSSLSFIFHFEMNKSLSNLGNIVQNCENFLVMNSYPLKLLVSVEEYLINNDSYTSNVLPYISSTFKASDDFLKFSVFTNPSTVFEQVYNAIYFSDACNGTKSAFGFQNNSDYQICQNISIGKLTGGLIIFQDYFYTKVEDTLKKNQDLLFGSITPGDLYNFEVAIEIIDYDMSENLLNLWIDSMSSKLTYERTKIIIILITISLLNVFIFLIAEKLVVGILYSNYIYFRDVYNRYMLAEALQKEKRIKAILVKLKMMNQ